jgi:acetolactate synthase small subunit
MPRTTTLTITLGDRPGALQRVISVCARRRLEVVSLAFQRADARVDLCLESEPRQLAGARAWLLALVDVLAVSEPLSPGTEPRPDRPGRSAAMP